MVQQIDSGYKLPIQTDHVPDVGNMVNEYFSNFLRWIRVNYTPCKTGWIDIETGNKHRLEDDLVCEYYEQLNKNK